MLYENSKQKSHLTNATDIIETLNLTNTAHTNFVNLLFQLAMPKLLSFGNTTESAHVHANDNSRQTSS